MGVGARPTFLGHGSCAVCVRPTEEEVDEKRVVVVIGGPKSFENLNR